MVQSQELLFFSLIRIRPLAVFGEVPLLKGRFRYSPPLLRQQLFSTATSGTGFHQPFQPPPLLDTAAEQIAFSWSGILDSGTRTSTREPQSKARICPVFQHFRASPPANSDSSETR
jgi:hypothetical protein